MEQIDIATPSAPASPIESASASTECQSGSSHFAYALTFIVLGVVSLIVIAVALLVFTAMTTAADDRDVEIYSLQGPDGLYLENMDGAAPFGWDGTCA